MKLISSVLAVCAAMTLSVSALAAGRYSETIALFKNAGQSATFFDKSYAYAVFPTIGEGAIGIGGAHGKGHLYVHGVWVGNVDMSQVSIGFQLGGKAFSQIIFFQDKRAVDEFESGTYEFDANASAVAVTAGANATAGTNGTDAGASGGMKDATTRGEFYKGVAVFTIAKGGLMGSLAVGGQKFSFTPRAAAKQPS
jgi:lipid-binding SYLF domain-containing protein